MLRAVPRKAGDNWLLPHYLSPFRARTIVERVLQELRHVTVRHPLGYNKSLNRLSFDHCHVERSVTRLRRTVGT